MGVSPANLRGIVYTYDKFDRKDLVSYPNGTAVDYTYNGATGWLSQVAHQKDGAANPFLSLTYARNGIGLIKGVSESANGAATGSWAYDYDGLKRLTAATWTPATGSPTLYGYTYDRNGNRRSYDVTGSARRHYVYNELDQLREERLGASLGASSLDKSYTWDKYGRMASEGGAGVPPAIDRLYKWTVDDRLVSVVLGDNPSNDPVIKYAYDHLGTRVSRSALGETAKHLTDYENPSGYSQTLAEVEGDGLNVLKNYFYGSEYGPLAQRGAGANSLAFLHGDHLQTTRQLTDGDGDVLLASSQKYEPFGTPTPDALSSLTSYAFTGQSRDLDTGLQYHRARWLNTSQGRWLSTDPVFDWPGNFGNTVLYAGANSISSYDGLGMFEKSELLVAASILLAVVVLSGVRSSLTGGTFFGGAGRALGGIILVLCVLVPLSLIPIVGPLLVAAIVFYLTAEDVEKLATEAGSAWGEGNYELALVDLALIGITITTAGYVGKGAYTSSLKQTQAVLADRTVPVAPAATTERVVQDAVNFADDGLRRAPEPAKSLEETLQEAADHADEGLSPEQGSRRPPVVGTLKHTLAEKYLEKNTPSGDDLHFEVWYKDGRPVEKGTAGAVRVDVVKGPLDGPEGVWDFKFGKKGLSEARIAEIRSHLPKVVRDTVPIKEVRPGAASPPESSP